MAYPRRLLTENEQVVVEVHPHWSFLGWTVPVSVLALAALIAQNIGWSSAPRFIHDVLYGLLGLALLWTAARVFKWRTTSVVITNVRLVSRRGVLSRSGLDVRLDRMNEISYHQSIVGRILGTGQLMVEVGGETGVVIFDHMRRPAALSSVVQEQLANWRRGFVPGPSSAGPSAQPSAPSSPDQQPRIYDPTSTQGPSTFSDTPPAGYGGGRSGGAHSEKVDPKNPVAQRLIELDELRRRGILSESEFATKKAELLEDL
jgi:hypothetical protein